MCVALKRVCRENQVHPHLVALKLNEVVLEGSGIGDNAIKASDGLTREGQPEPRRQLTGV